MTSRTLNAICRLFGRLVPPFRRLSRIAEFRRFAFYVVMSLGTSGAFAWTPPTLEFGWRLGGVSYETPQEICAAQG